MFFPVRCWTCGKVIGHLWEEFREELNRAKICNDRIDSLLPLFQKLGLKDSAVIQCSSLIISGSRSLLILASPKITKIIDCGMKIETIRE
uniref:DNA-directed RNA polymerase n=1 Tax=Sarcoptes scabiei TaxID=52283 RepID=A0A834VFL0_SARSC